MILQTTWIRLQILIQKCQKFLPRTYFHMTIYHNWALITSTPLRKLIGKDLNINFSFEFPANLPQFILTFLRQYSVVLNKRAARLFIFDNFPSYTLLLGTYTFINFHKIFYLHKLFIPFKGIFCFFVVVH